MSIIVSDTSPLQLLVQVGEVHVLERLFGQVVLPPEVVSEMTHPKAPAVVRGFVTALPPWVRTQAPTIQLTLPALDPGEVAAITLAVVPARIRALPFRVADAILQASLARHLANRANP